MLTSQTAVHGTELHGFLALPRDFHTMWLAKHIMLPTPKE
jgi:hypothetical protein